MQLVASLTPWWPKSVHVEFVVDRMALGEVFLRVLPFYHIGAPYAYIVWEMNGMALADHSSEK
jgi:hypothetical protein